MSIQQLFTAMPQERVEFSLRRHPIVFLGPILTFVVLLVLPFAARAILIDGKALSEAVTHPFAYIALVLLVSAYFIGVLTFFLGQFMDYYLDIDIVTNERILDILQKGLFGRSISELDLTRVQDVHSEIKGIIPTLLNYGTVVIQTAAEEENFVFDQVPGPHKVRQRILELAALDRKKEAQEIMKGATPGQAAAAENELKRQGL